MFCIRFNLALFGLILPLQLQTFPFRRPRRSDPKQSKQTYFDETSVGKVVQETNVQNLDPKIFGHPEADPPVI